MLWWSPSHFRSLALTGFSPSAQSCFYSSEYFIYSFVKPLSYCYLAFFSFYHLPFVMLSTYISTFLSLFIFSRVILLLICKVLFIFF